VRAFKWWGVGFAPVDCQRLVLAAGAAHGQNDWSPTLVCSVRGSVRKASRWQISNDSTRMSPRQLTTDEAHAAACRALGGCVEIQRLLQRWGNAVYCSLSPPSEEHPHWVEWVLIGASALDPRVPKATVADDPSESTYVLATCRVHPETGEAEITVEPSPRILAR
jgi:hypothetical protein